MKLTITTIVLAAFFLAFQIIEAKPIPRIPPPPKKEDKTLLQGEWVREYVEWPTGVKQDPEKAKLIVKNDDWLLSSSKLNFIFKIDATKTPKQIDLISDGKTWPGIFKIEGDTMTHCRSHGAGGERPTAFTGGPGIMLMVFKRAGK